MLEGNHLIDTNNIFHRSGYIALVGRPNAGKSTLLNQILGTKLVAVTPRPQTTRNRIFGIYDREDAQVIFQDTPGLLEAKDALHHFMVNEATRALEDADLVVWLVDSIKGITSREHAIAQKMIAPLALPLYIVFNKIDKVPLDQRATLEQGLDFIQFKRKPTTFYISALFGDGVERLLNTLIEQLPEGPKFYPPDQLSDRTQRFFIQEIIREKAFLMLKQEVPYSLAVLIEEMKEKENGITTIHATIYVERTSQKGIIVGKNGQTIKVIGSEARKEIEELVGSQVFLKLWVKVGGKWRKNTKDLRTFGYTEE